MTDTKLIAEPWDAAGLYQVGRFPFGRRWSEWNGRYRDDIRRFWRGDRNMVTDLATRLCGSADLYEASGRQPRHSLNFITCHDGFTLWDLVSYNQKHNEANGEDNRDGSNDNFSWNCGVEGTTTNAQVLALRERQAKNLLTTLLLSQGVPMLLAGDEFLRTQQGNNNAWCQDNEISWLNWDLAKQNADMVRFVRELIALRKGHPALRRHTFFRGKGADGQQERDIRWHGVEAFKPDFSATSRTLAYTLNGRQTGREPDCDFYVAMNAWRETLSFGIPPAPTGRRWRRVVDTGQESPKDIIEMGQGPHIDANSSYLVTAFSVLVLVSEP